jgi:hypothetical protein
MKISIQINTHPIIPSLSEKRGENPDIFHKYELDKGHRYFEPLRKRDKGKTRWTFFKIVILNDKGVFPSFAYAGVPAFVKQKWGGRRGNGVSVRVLGALPFQFYE